MSEKQSTDIVIYGHKLALGGTADQGRRIALAAKVDQRMREVAKRGEPLHLAAILTALVLMDEITRLQQMLEGERQKVDQAARGAAQLDLRIQHLLQEALAPVEEEPRIQMEDQGEELNLDDSVLFKDKA